MSAALNVAAMAAGVGCGVYAASLTMTGVDFLRYRPRQPFRALASLAVAVVFAGGAVVFFTL